MDTAHYTAKAGQTEAAHLLIRCGADCSASAKDGTTPLHLASANENREVVRVLLDAGASVNASDSAGNTPLHLRTQWRDTTIPQLLISAGAPLNVTNCAGKTPLRIAVERRSVGVIELLMNVGARPEVGLNGETLLHVAAACGPMDSVLDWQTAAYSILVLLKHCLPIDARDSQGYTPLHRAVSALNWSAVTTLVSNGADINATDGHGNTPLHLIAQQERDEVGLRVCPNIAELAKQQETLLSQVPVPDYITNINLTAWLLAHGANPNLTNFEGRTPLELVCDRQWRYWDKSSATNRVMLLFNAGTKVSKPGYGTLEECLEKIK